MVHVGHLEVEWSSAFQVSFLCRDCHTRLGLVVFLESEETLLFLARPELGIGPQMAVEAICDANLSKAAVVAAPIQLTDDQIRHIFGESRR